MACFYADEQFPRRIVEALRNLGHDTLTVQETESRGLSDQDILEFSSQEKRVVLTFNRRDFIRLHSIKPDHAGIVVCKDDPDRVGMALRIHKAISVVETLDG